MVSRVKNWNEYSEKEKKENREQVEKELEKERPRRHQEVLKAFGLTAKEFPIENLKLRGLDYSDALSAAIKKNKAESSIPPLKVTINGMDKQPQSYSESMHEKITSKSQGATDVSPLPKAFVSSSPMPGT
jgi:hypothetical protein